MPQATETLRLGIKARADGQTRRWREETTALRVQVAQLAALADRAKVLVDRTVIIYHQDAPIHAGDFVVRKHVPLLPHQLANGHCPDQCRYGPARWRQRDGSTCVSHHSSVGARI